MYEKFGFMDSVEKLNMAAEGFRKEGDMESLVAMALENGFDEEDARDYGDGLMDEFATKTSATVARMLILRKEIGKMANKQHKANQIFVWMILQSIMNEEKIADVILLHRNFIEDFITVMKSCMVSTGTDEDMRRMIRAYANGGKEEYKKVATEINKRYE